MKNGGVSNLFSLAVSISPSLSLSLSIFVCLSGLIWHAVKGTDVNSPVTQLFSRCTDSHVFSVRGRRNPWRRGGERVDSKCGTNHVISCWGGEGKGGNGIFYFEKSCGGMGWGVEWVLHKLSSRSACIAWPTVQRDEWNVGQTPPPLSFFLSFALSVTFSFCSHKHHSTVDFWKTDRNVWCWMPAFVLPYQINKLQQVKTAVWLDCEGCIPTHPAFI